MAKIEDSSVDLVVTSPPYPMIEMWDGIFSEMNPAIGTFLLEGEADRAYDLMHQELDKAWGETWRILKPGGIACINIGDATRTLGEEYRLYPSHSTISMSMKRLGFYESPSIIWKKQTNSPNKFLGSGTMPPGAYVTLEHEYILIFRKPPRRQFPSGREKESRAASSYFWEERNAWFTDIWEDIKGARQSMHEADTRKRSAAFPFEVPFRLINMFSVKGDTVVDPFAGTGTTVMAAAASGRNSVGYEKDNGLASMAMGRLLGSVPFLRSAAETRISSHSEYVEAETASGRNFPHWNSTYGFMVKTAPEERLEICVLKEITQAKENGCLVAHYEPQAKSQRPAL